MAKVELHLTLIKSGHSAEKGKKPALNLGQIIRILEETGGTDNLNDPALKSAYENFQLGLAMAKLGMPLDFTGDNSLVTMKDNRVTDFNSSPSKK